MSTTSTPRPIHAAVASLDKQLSHLAALRKELTETRLPLPAAEDRLDNVDDLLAIVGSQLNRALDLCIDEMNALDAGQEAIEEALHDWHPVAEPQPIIDIITGIFMPNAGVRS